jgi:SAM-dependent methyltransferase
LRTQPIRHGTPGQICFDLAPRRSVPAASLEARARSAQSVRAPRHYPAFGGNAVGVGTTPTQPWETDQRDAFRGRVGEGPDAYDRTRPVAPDSLFDDIVQLAGLKPGSMVVEIGPGTGQATRRLAERGLRILALEIDPRLAARARHNLGAFPDVSARTTSFEAWHLGEATFDVVFACNSFHWVDPDIGFVKAAAVLPAVADPGARKTA